MSMDERWVTRTPNEMLKTFHWFQGEGFDLILEDLLELPRDPPVLAEGFRLLPRLVLPLLTRVDQAVWLVPTPAFRRVAFDTRGFTWDIPRKTTAPERALANLLLRDHLFSEQVAEDAKQLSLHVIEVDGSLGVGELTTRVARALSLPPD